MDIILRDMKILRIMKRVFPCGMVLLLSFVLCFFILVKDEQVEEEGLQVQKLGMVDNLRQNKDVPSTPNSESITTNVVISTAMPKCIQIDIAMFDKYGEPLSKPRISMGGRDMTPMDVYNRVIECKDKYDSEFSVLIRADFKTPHAAVKDVMDACTKAGIWKISFMAVSADKME